MDVLKALALGTTAVGIGCPVCCGLAVAGIAGVALTVRILQRELELAMALAGGPNLNSIDGSVIRNRQFPVKE